jgi:cystathionine beta-lyase/cystathionine gamma-synthase
MSWEEGMPLIHIDPSSRTYPISLILNPKVRSYPTLKSAWNTNYEDNHWAEDSIFLERNSRDFVTRIERININAEAICDVLLAHPRGKSSSPYTWSTPTHCFNSEAGKLPETQSHATVLRQMS